MTDWTQDQQWEKDWHGNCANSFFEETKQIVYMPFLGLNFTKDHKTPYNIDLNKKTVLDIGGGPYSLLLKAYNFSKATVVDPCEYPDWVYMRYKECGIDFILSSGEDFTTEEVYDELWMYNVLQHTHNPQQIISNARKCSKIIRVFDWVEHGISPGHPQNLIPSILDEWFGGNGKIEDIKGGKCYSGIFIGDYFENSNLSRKR